jgi:threonine/homoserine/homoserine lactone efflux protein
MKHYLLFVLVATATVFSPGPGVIMTLTNSLRHGLYGAFGGIALQSTNPKAIFFFLSIFPQFIAASDRYSSQFIALVMTYSFSVVIIHLLYALTAHRAKAWLTSATGGRIVNKAGGVTFMFFGVALAKANR